MAVLHGTLMGTKFRSEQHEESVPARPLVQQQLVSLSVRARLDANAQRSRHRVFESCGGCDLVGMRGYSPRPRLCVAHELGFEIPDGPAAVGGALSEVTSAVVVRFGEERFAMSFRQSSALDQLDRLIGQFEQPDGVGEVAAASSEPSCEVGAGDLEVVEEPGDAACFFDDGEVGAGDVLDQGELERDGVVGTVVNEAA
jgi:hypothetical protein